MGIFKKAKDAAGMVHVKGAGLVDPAILGGPSTRSVASDDPIWAPINGISLEDYAGLARDAQAKGITDMAGMVRLGEERGWDPADTQAALDGWVVRMGQSMAVGQRFRKLLGY
ncbi:hypothetical protein TUM20985_15700 [Mycobacterium antarcticum]|uniref:hypothetical protein n=1 Tax=Mycolicibacterium sp. TUM20985 TaxID=3023370 RepID=UPI00257229AB|nr:hypothetical protein [Mycolicibacterium sp. TUM20985]BDX31023.1 hypothetical protein TUM20985_15700 [Mycolicibacterium sp. TUM20985]